MTEIESIFDTQQIYTVAPGDSLGTIAQLFYGDASLWQPIWEANKMRIRNPATIAAGQVLVIPDR